MTARKRLLLSLLILCVSTTTYAMPLQVKVLGSDGAPVSGLVVFLESQSGGPAPGPVSNEPFEMGQDDGRFEPYIGVIQTGEPVLFTNDDDFTHHVYSFNGPARFSFQLRPGEGERLDRFDTPGVVAIGCNLHDWMSSYLLILDSPYHARTDESGIARLEAPAGQYRATAWHPQLQERNPATINVELPAGGIAELQLTRPMAEIPEQREPGMFDFLDRF